MCDYAAAHAHLAWCHEWCLTRGGFDEADKKAALAHAQATIASDTDDAAALAVAGWVTIVLSKEHELALGAIERALSLNPSCAMAHYYAVLTNAFANRPKAVALHAKPALRLSPFDPANFEAIWLSAWLRLARGSSRTRLHASPRARKLTRDTA